MIRIAALGQRCDGSAAALPPLAPGGSDSGRQSSVSSVLQPASSELRRANVRDSRLGSLALKETPTIAQ